MLKLSGGQQRRLDVAIALVGDPELLFLDEPTTGFDPSARHEAWEVIKNLATLGKTVLLTTHYMDEAQYLADRVAVIVGRPDRGRGSARPRSATVNWPRRGSGTAARPARLPRTGCPRRPGPDGYTEITPDDVVQALHQLTGWAHRSRVSLDGLEVTRPSLEDVYLSLTGCHPTIAAAAVPAGRKGRTA